MWCIGKLTKEYRQRMYDLLELYTRSYCEDEPVICVDEKSKQLLEQLRAPIPASPGHPVKEDCEYKRAGTRNIFMAVEPKGGCRQVEVTTRRTKRDFVQFIGHLVKKAYVSARKIHLVLDNLNTHFRSSFEEILGVNLSYAFKSISSWYTRVFKYFPHYKAVFLKVIRFLFIACGSTPSFLYISPCAASTSVATRTWCTWIPSASGRTTVTT